MIAVIAGHKGEKTGAIGYIDEGKETIEFRNLLLKELLDKQIPFIYDGEKDELSKVVSNLKHILDKNDICVDIHFNSYTDDSVNGSEVIIPDNYNSIEKDLANKLLQSTCNILNTKNRKIKTEKQTARKKLAMLRDINCNNILIEICFVSNKKDCDLYLKNKERLAKEYADILCEAYNSINK